jgi:hypothetical protein
VTRWIKFVLAVLAVPVLVTGQTGPSVQTPRGSINGIVVRTGTSDPIPGVDVELTRVNETEQYSVAVTLLSARALQMAAGILPSVTGPATSTNPEVVSTRTGSDGRFAFSNLKPGTYRLAAARVGGAYTPAEYGQRDPLGRGVAFPLAQDETLSDLKLQMAPTGTISGRVFDADGEGLGHVSVMALQDTYKNGQRVLNIVQAVHSDDRGIYELFWLPPGHYRIAAKLDDLQRRSVPLFIVPPGRAGPNERITAPVVIGRTLSTGEAIEEVFGLVYLGGGVDPGRAQSIELAPGASITSADIPMSSGTRRAFHIRGRIIKAGTGEPAVGAVLRAFPLLEEPNTLVSQSSLDANGSFDLEGLVPGKYVLFAATSMLTVNFSTTGANYILNNISSFTTSSLNATVPVEIRDSDINDLIVTVRPGVALSGKFTIEGRPSQDVDPDIARLRLSLVREPEILGMPTGTPGAWAGVAQASQPNGVPASDGSFTLQGVTDGDYRAVPLPMPSNSYLKAIRLGPIDVLRDGLHVSGQTQERIEIVIATDTSTVTGTVLNDQRQPAANAVVALIPEGTSLHRRFDLFRNATTDGKGQFRLKAVPPGDYRVFSWNYAEANAWENDEFMKPYQGSGKLVHIDPQRGQNISTGEIILLK